MKVNRMDKVEIESVIDEHWLIISRWKRIEEKLENFEELSPEELEYYNENMKGHKLEDKIAFLLENNYWEI